LDLPALQTAALQAAANGILIMNRLGLIEWANPAAARLTGYGLEELVGQNPRIFKSGQHSSGFYQDMWRTILAGEIWHGETVNRRKDGSLYTEEQTITPVRDESGRITHFIAIKQDITPRKQAEKALEIERQRLFALMDGLPALVYLKAPDCSIRYANRLFKEYYGDPQGHLCYQLVRGRSDPCPDCRTPEIIKSLQPQHWERQHGDGRTFQTYNYPFTDVDGQQVVLELAIDITELSQARGELEQVNQSLLALSRAEHAQRELAEGLFQAALATSTSLDLEEVLDRILEQTLSAIPSQAALLIMVEGNSAQVVRQRGLQEIPQLASLLETTLPLDAFHLVKKMSRTKRPFIVDDSSADPERLDIPGLEWVQAYAAAPLLNDNQVAGMIILFSDQVGYFTPAVAAPLQAFAIHAGLALKNARLYETEQRLRQVAEVMSAAGQALTQSLNLDHVLQTLLEYLDRLVTYDSAAIYLAQDQGIFHVYATRGYERFTDPAMVLQHSLDTQTDYYVRDILKKQHSILISDTDTDPDWAQRPGWEHIRCWLGIPLVAGGTVIGLCSLDKIRPDCFSLEHQRLAETLVGQAAVIVQNAWLFEQVRAGRERLLSLSHRLVEVQESERRYIARELHDETGQALTSLKLGLSLLERQTSDPQAVRETTADLKSQVESVLEELHRLAMDLRPASLDHLGLKAALQQHLEDLGARHGLQVQLVVLNLDSRLPAEIEVNLYRIVQEALTNVVRHANASRVEVLLEQRVDSIVAIVEDNGDGFDPQRPLNNQSLGLFGMRERAEMLGGKLVIEVQPGEGTTIYVEVPYGDPDPDR